LKRRDFIELIGGAAAWPFAAHAQQPTRTSVGFLNILSPDTTQSFVAAFRQGLKETGFTEDRNLTIEYRWAEGQYGRLPGMAQDLIQNKVAVLVAVAPPAVFAAKAATTTTPIVFISGLDPVKAGFVSNFTRPGGNVTGVSMGTAALGSKRLALLREMIPTAVKIALLVNPSNPNTDAQLNDLQPAVASAGLTLQTLRASNPSEIDGAFAILQQQPPHGLIVGADPFFVSRRGQIVALAARQAIPAIYDWREYAVAGGLMSYGTSLEDAHRLAGAYTGRVLKGAKPADLPVVEASKFETVINLKTANALGIKVPRLMLARAEEVIE
jgi:putative ABC transport system substrate-binding protein